jgi:hypothetical protein
MSKKEKEVESKISMTLHQLKSIISMIEKEKEKIDETDGEYGTYISNINKKHDVVIHKINERLVVKVDFTTEGFIHTEFTLDEGMNE